MAEHSRIEWTDATWNPITGCSVISPGCKRCYAMRLAGGRMKTHPSRAGLTVDTQAGPVWTGEVRLNEGWLDQPFRWRRPRRIFVCAHGDLFHESAPFEWIDQVYGVMALTPHHTYQVLTKRPDRRRKYLADSRRLERMLDTPIPRPAGEAPLGCLIDFDVFAKPLANVWEGVSAENEHWARIRVPQLLETPAAVRFLSAEPLLSEIDVEPYVLPVSQWSGYWLNDYPLRYPEHRLDCVIAGGESGSGARPAHPDWIRSIRDLCDRGRVPFFFKQWGEWGPGEPTGGQVMKFLRADGSSGGFYEPGTALMSRRGKKEAGRLLDGRPHDELPHAGQSRRAA